MEAEKVSRPKVIIATAKPTEPATLPRTREGFAIKQEQIHLFREEMKTDAMEVKSIVSSHFIISSHNLSSVMSHCGPGVPFNRLTDQQNIRDEIQSNSSVEQLAFPFVKNQIK